MRNQLIYGEYTFADVKITSGELTQSQDLAAGELAADAISIEVSCNDPEIRNFSANAPMTYYHRGQQKGIYYLQSVSRVGPNRYVLSGYSAVGLLSKMPHAGGVYTGQRAEDVIKEICGAMPVMVKTILADLQVYGWLPYAKPPDRAARDNLSQVLLAIGAHLKTDLNGVLRVEPLWDGTSSEVGMGRIYQGASVEYAAPVSTVAVTEHQYAQGAEEQELFQGTAQEGELITFDEPMHSLTASGFTILESGANYAVLSAGVGTLTGKKYIHTTRQITRTVTEGAAENVQSITDATLVSLVNSSAVADRLAEFYRCRETITGGIVAGAERTGDVISVYHPFDKTVVPACIQTLDSAMSAVLKSEMSALVSFLPPQPDDARYITERIILTGEGEFEVPADAGDLIHYVLFSGADGGGAGLPGTASGTAKSYSASETGYISGKTTTANIRMWGEGGKGGEGGPGGSGSKFLEGDLSITPGMKIQYSCGVGGVGAVFEDIPVSGGLGTATTMGSLTTDNGVYAPASGWKDPITGETFAAAGKTGLPGGDAAQFPPDYEIPTNTFDLTKILRFVDSAGALDEDGTLWPGGSTVTNGDHIGWYQDPIPTWHVDGEGVAGALSGYTLGPGGAAGATPPAPVRGTHSLSASSVTATAPDGLQGGTPTLTPKKPALTVGGTGGYGGGGGGCPGYALVEKVSDYTGSTTPYPGAPGPGGFGGEGGPGGDGMIILYISRVRTIQSGRFLTRDGQDFLDRLDRRVIV